MNTSFHRNAITLTAGLIVIAAIGCGTDFAATPASSPRPPSDGPEGFGAAPTTPPAEEVMTATQIIERAHANIKNAESFEALLTRNYVDLYRNDLSTTLVRKSSPQLVSVLFESNGAFSEQIFANGTRYWKYGTSGDQLTGLWQPESGVSLPAVYTEIEDSLLILDSPVLSSSPNEQHIQITGSTAPPHPSWPYSRGPGISDATGLVTVIIERSTFRPISISYEIKTVGVNSDDPSIEWESTLTVTTEFLSINQAVHVELPHPDMIGAAVVQPTPTAAPTSTPVWPPNIPPVPAPDFNPSPPTSVDQFLADIQAAAPGDVFEPTPGIVFVFQPCGDESDGIVTARVFDLSSADEPGGRGYFANIQIDTALKTWAVDYPTRTTSSLLSRFVEDPANAKQVIDRADPAVRCAVED